MPNSAPHLDSRLCTGRSTVPVAVIAVPHSQKNAPARGVGSRGVRSLYLSSCVFEWPLLEFSLLQSLLTRTESSGFLCARNHRRTICLASVCGSTRQPPATVLRQVHKSRHRYTLRHRFLHAKTAVRHGKVGS